MQGTRRAATPYPKRAARLLRDASTSAHRRPERRAAAQQQHQHHHQQQRQRQHQQHGQAGICDSSLSSSPAHLSQSCGHARVHALSPLAPLFWWCRCSAASATAAAAASSPSPRRRRRRRRCCCSPRPVPFCSSRARSLCPGLLRQGLPHSHLSVSSASTLTQCPPTASEIPGASVQRQDIALPSRLARQTQSCFPFAAASSPACITPAAETSRPAQRRLSTRRSARRHRPTSLRMFTTSLETRTIIRRIIILTTRRDPRS